MHHLYTGVSLTGKTTLARHIARALHKRGHSGIVYDPTLTSTLGGGWGFTEIYTEPEPFLARLESPELEKCHVFVDEADEIFGHQYPENFWALKKGRHFGLFMHLMTQRPTMLAPTVRANTHKAFIFRLASDDAYEIGKDYGHSDIHRISLDRGDFLMLESGSSAIKRGNIFQLVQGESSCSVSATSNSPPSA